MGNYNLLVFFVLIVGVCVAGGIPIAFAFGTATLAYLALVTDAPLQIVVSRMDEGMSGLILLSVPLFVLLGALIEMSGLARSLIEFMAALLGHVRGGLQYVLLGAMFLVSGISGSKAADMAAVAPALFPEMQRRGSKPEDLVALLSSTGAMTETIPEPGAHHDRRRVRCVDHLALRRRPAARGHRNAGHRRGVFRTFAQGSAECGPPRAVARDRQDVHRGLAGARPADSHPHGRDRGAATATEVSTVGIAYTVVIGLIVHAFKKHLNFKRLYPLLTETAALSGAILLIIGMATAMAWALTQSGFSAALVSLMHGMPGGQVGFLLISMVVFIILGSVLEGIPAIVLFGPLLFPVARSWAFMTCITRWS